MPLATLGADDWAVGVAGGGGWSDAGGPAAQAEFCGIGEALEALTSDPFGDWFEGGINDEKACAKSARENVDGSLGLRHERL